MASLVTKALILAGGMGTRLRAVVNDVPKPLAPVEGRPFLEYLLEYWIAQGIHHFIISTGYLGALVVHHFGSSFQGSTLCCSQEEKPLGTGGAVKKSLGLAVLAHEETILLLNGDTWFEASLESLEEAINAHAKVAACLALRKIKENTRYGGVCLTPDGRISSFGNTASVLINAGCALLRPKLLTTRLQGFPEVFSLERELFPLLAQEGLLAGRTQEGAFIDIGIPADYWRFQEYIAQKF